MAGLMTKSERKQRLRDRHKVWLTTISRESGRTLTAIARDAGLDQSALTRFMNDDERGATLDSLTIDAIMEVTNAPAPFEQANAAPRPAGFAESEAEPYDPTPHDLAPFGMENAHLAWFTLRSRALEFEGIRVGDRLIVDLNRAPKTGDIVCAQIYNWSRANDTQTVFRLYEPPALVASGPPEAGRKTRLIDGENVVVRGVVRGVVRTYA